jgi:hypothetical protein
MLVAGPGLVAVDPGRKVVERLFDPLALGNDMAA